MPEFPPFSGWSLWIILVFIVAYSIAGMAIGNRLREEKFLEGKYGETYLNYKHATPRYLLF